MITNFKLFEIFDAGNYYVYELVLKEKSNTSIFYKKHFKFIENEIHNKYLDKIIYDFHKSE